MQESSQTTSSFTPLSLIAEVTHRCPLHCLYCSNPLELQRANEELSTEDWQRVITQASALGIVHLHLTGGEPLSRGDLPQLIRTGRDEGLYVNLVTSGIGLNEQRMSELADAGLEHIQLSFQDVDEATANYVAGTRAHAHKRALVSLLKKFPWALTINLVVHRLNLDRIEHLIAMAEELDPERIEIAHVQYYGWALKNRHLLMPTPDQVRRSLPLVEAARQRLADRLQLEVVTPDYFGRFPKACMGGWGRQVILVDPVGRALPCHAAGVIPGLHLDNVRDSSLEWIWNDSDAFQRFRGDAWMPAICKSCDRKERDFGGCRCQSFLLTGDAQAIDPVCNLSDDHHLIEKLRNPIGDSLPIWRL